MLDRQVRIVLGSLIVLCVALEWVLPPLGLILTAFMGASLVFSGATGVCGTRPLLALLPWNRAKKPTASCGTTDVEAATHGGSN